MKIINGTPHEISIYREEDCIFHETSRKLIAVDGAQPFKVIEKGIPLNAIQKLQFLGIVEGIDVKELQFVDVDLPSVKIPDYKSGDAIIASNLYASAARTLKCDFVDNLYTVGGTVYDSPENPKPIGCLYLISAK